MNARDVAEAITRATDMHLREQGSRPVVEVETALGRFIVHAAWAEGGALAFRAFVEGSDHSETRLLVMNPQDFTEAMIRQPAGGESIERIGFKG